MRIGFVTTLLWSRYGSFWWDLVQDAGAEPVRSDPAAVRAALADPRIDHVGALAFRVAAADAIALPACDLIVAPDLNPGVDTGRGGGQDPWVVSFPEALASSVSGLPSMFGIPSELGDDVEPRALELLRAIDRDPTRVRRVWERHRASMRAPRVGSVRWQLRPSETRTVGVVGQPWLVQPSLLAGMGTAQEHLVGQHELDPASLRDEGARFDPALVPTDAEAVGAARLFARRGLVKEVRVLLDPEIGADAWLLRRIRDVVRKELTVVSVRDLTDPVAALTGDIQV
jgi:hypothetical protein